MNNNNALISSQDFRIFKEVKKSPSDWGRIVESAVGAHLINNAVREGYNLYYWRDRNNEVDYVLERNNSIIAIEVKSNISKNKKGIREFVKRFSPEKTYIIDKRGLNWEEFLRINPLELL